MLSERGMTFEAEIWEWTCIQDICQPPCPENRELQTQLMCGGSEPHGRDNVLWQSLSSQMSAYVPWER